MSIDCTKASRLISRRVDRAIGGEDAQALEGHLRTCVACRREARHQEQIAAAMVALPDPEVPKHLVERIRQAVRDEPDVGAS